MSQVQLPTVDDLTLVRSFAPGTLRRGRAYADEGRVGEVTLVSDDPDELVLAAEVAGSDPTPYGVDVVVVHTGRSRHVYADCECPVGDNCKHAAAVLYAVGLVRRSAPAAGSAAVPGAPGPATGSPAATMPSWGRRLAEMLDGLDSEVARSGPVKALAIQVELDVPPERPRVWTQRSEPTVRLRPLQRGARDKWVKSGAGWRDVASMPFRHQHDPAQIAALAELAALSSSTYYTSTLSSQPPDAGDFGPGLWAVLRRARAVGLALVPAGPISAVDLLDDPVSLSVDLFVVPGGVGGAGDTGDTGDAGGAGDTGDADHADVRLEVGVRHGDHWWSGDRLILLGPRGHGVALLCAPEDPDNADAAGARGAHPRLVLAQLDGVLPEPVCRLVRAGERLEVPGSDLPALVRDYLPRLRRHLPVTSSDGSVELPEPLRPALLLTVTWHGPATIDLTWQWAYGHGDERQLFQLDSADGHDTVRLPREEAHLLDRISLEGTARRVLAGPDGRPVPRQRLPHDRVLAFVQEVLPALRDSEAVQVVEEGPQPAYREATDEPEIRFDLTGPAGSAERRDAERTDWLDLGVVITVDGEQVPLASVIEALTLGQDRIFLPSGLHLPADHPAFARLAEAVRAAGELVEQDDDGLRVGRHDLSLWAELAELGLVDAQAEHWVRAAQALRDVRELPQDHPTGVVTALRDYQLDGFRWLTFLRRAGLGGVLADDMGLGKTLQALATISTARAEGAGPFLVVAPTSVVSGWVHEAGRHTPDLAVRGITASGRRRGSTIAEEAAASDVVVTSYTLLRLEAEQYAEVAWGGLVLDEAQQVKNHQGKTYQAVRRLDVPFRLALTGTPFENRLMELWSLLSIVAPGLYPWPQRFAEQVANPVERGGDTAVLERFRRRIRPFLLRRTKELVADDLPPKQEQVLEVTLGSRHRKVYDTHLQRERQTVLGLVDDFDRNRIAIFRSLTRLRQLSLDPGLLDPEYDRIGSAKLDLLVEHLVELTAEGHRALVFSQFTSFLRRVRARLEREQIPTSYLDGTTSDRAEVIAGFRRGDAPVFLISLKAGGVGLTLTEADYVFVLDPWWNPAVEAQAVDRAHRIGQQRPVMVYRLVASATIEEKVMELKARKAALFAQVLDGDGAMAQGVTADDVRALLGS